ncbi:OmpA/MotB domain protein [Candidatus Sulfopaludibacter sp. SbA3]|nr:OmpA/MotB domain protein [Candidatus Sulfopaludibacter sp. SbA3]
MIRPKRETHPKPERWMVSYADFITLLCAFFVVMFAVAQEDRGKAKDVSESVRRALDNRAWSTHQQAAPPPAVPQPPLVASQPELLVPFQKLSTELADEIAAGKMQARLEPRGIVVSLREKGFFSSGADQIHPDAFASMAKIAKLIHDLPNAVRLEGHTDSVPIHNVRFRSNWDLSAARSIAVLTWFESHYGIPPLRFTISGSADNQPVAENGSEEGRAQNRRVDIVILNQAGR